MPDHRNVTSPILVVGPVRSGSSWLLHVLNQHPDVRMLIENRALEAVYHEVFHSYWSRNWEWECDADELRLRAVNAARSLLCALFPTQTPAWGMKLLSRGRPWEFVREVFPAARYIHLARSPTTAIPSMMEFVGDSYAVWKDIETCQAEFVDSHREALSLESAGVPYLRIRQEDAAADPQRVWREVTEFCGLGPTAVPGLTDEINAARSTQSRARAGRPPLPWSQFSPAVLEVATELGYFERAAATPGRSTADGLVAELENQVTSLNAREREHLEQAASLRAENSRLRLALSQAVPLIEATRLVAAGAAGGPSDLSGGPPDDDAERAAEALLCHVRDMLDLDADGGGPNGHVSSSHAPAAPDRRTHRARIIGARVVDGDGQPRSTFELRSQITIDVTVEALADLDDLSVSYKLRDERGNDIVGTTTFDERVALPALTPGQKLTVRFAIRNHLRPGIYAVTSSVNRVSKRDYSDNELLDERDGLATLTVPRDPGRPVHYAVYEPADIRVEPHPAG